MVGSASEGRSKRTGESLPWFLELRYGPVGLVFLSSGCIMVLEIVAGRLVARYLGSSLYTWTSVIAVVLGGIAAGNFLGGRLAARFDPSRVLAALFMVCALVTGAIVLTDHWVETAQLFAGSTWPVRIALSVTLVFFPPCAVLGTVSPVVVTAALTRSKDPTGHTVGNLHAASAIGSIAGTLLAGFVLIGLFGTRAIVWGVAGCLALLALASAGTSAKRIAAAIIAGISLGAARETVASRGWIVEERGVAAGGKTEMVPVRYETESDYFHIQVVPLEMFGAHKKFRYPGSRVLLLDAMVHGFVVPGRPELLEYEYEELTASLTRRSAGDKTRLDTLFIGGGAYTFPRYAEVKYPGSTVHVVEIDPAVTEAVHEAMDLPRTTAIRSFNEDARQFLVRGTETKYDVVYGDAFSGFSVPWHLTTREFDQLVKGVLREDGAYILNLVDSEASQQFVGASYNTLRTVFEHVYVFGIPGSQTRETYVVFATDAEIDVSGLKTDDGQTLRARALDDAGIARIVERSGGLVLTDDFAPVDQLTAPVFRHRREF